MIKEIFGDCEEIVRFKSKGVKKTEVLKFTKLRVVCLDISNQPDADIWMFSNYFDSDDCLSLDQRIAFQIYIKKKVRELAKFSYANLKEFYKEVVKKLSPKNKLN